MNMTQNPAPNNRENSPDVYGTFQPEIHGVNKLSDWHATPQY
jgi:hypothetical protein